MILVKKFAKSFECPEFTEEPILVLFLNHFKINIQFLKMIICFILESN